MLVDAFIAVLQGVGIGVLVFAAAAVVIGMIAVSRR